MTKMSLSRESSIVAARRSRVRGCSSPILLLIILICVMPLGPSTLASDLTPEELNLKQQVEASIQASKSNSDDVKKCDKIVKEAFTARSKNPEKALRNAWFVRMRLLAVGSFTMKGFQQRPLPSNVQERMEGATATAKENLLESNNTLGKEFRVPAALRHLGFLLHLHKRLQEEQGNKGGPATIDLSYEEEYITEEEENVLKALYPAVQIVHVQKNSNIQDSSLMPEKGQLGIAAMLGPDKQLFDKLLQGHEKAERGNNLVAVGDPHLDDFVWGHWSWHEVANGVPKGDIGCSYLECKERHHPLMVVYHPN